MLMFQGFLAWGLWSLRKQFVSRDQCDEKSKEHTDGRTELEKQQAVIKQAQDMAPSGTEMKAINKRLGDIEGDIKALRVSSKAQAETMDRIERPVNILLEHHLRGERK